MLAVPYEQMADPVGDTKRLIELVSRMDEDIRLDKWILGFVVPIAFLVVCSNCDCSRVHLAVTRLP